MRNSRPLPALDAVQPARRQAFGALGALGAMTLAACGGGSDTTTTTASSNATLAGLSLSVAGLTPAFASGSTAYTLAVANNVASLTLLPTAADGGATIRVNNEVVGSGVSSAAIALAVGTTTLSVVQRGQARIGGRWSACWHPAETLTAARVTATSSGTATRTACTRATAAWAMPARRG